MPLDSSGCDSCAKQFIKRKGFALRPRTSTCEKVPGEFEDKLIRFQQHVIELGHRRDYMMGHIGNMNETPLWFDTPMSMA